MRSKWGAEIPLPTEVKSLTQVLSEANVDDIPLEQELERGIKQLIEIRSPGNLDRLKAIILELKWSEMEEFATGISGKADRIYHWAKQA